MGDKSMTDRKVLGLLVLLIILISTQSTLEDDSKFDTNQGLLSVLLGSGVSHHGCGSNPLLELVREMPPWLADMPRSTRRDMPAQLREFMLLKRRLARFKDCVKTGDGVRAKKSEMFEPILQPM